MDYRRIDERSRMAGVATRSAYVSNSAVQSGNNHELRAGPKCDETIVSGAGKYTSKHFLR